MQSNNPLYVIVRRENVSMMKGIKEGQIYLYSKRTIYLPTYLVL